MTSDRHPIGSSHVSGSASRAAKQSATERGHAWWRLAKYKAATSLVGCSLPDRAGACRGRGGGLTDKELFAELGVGEAAGDQTKHLEFALGQVVELRGVVRGGGAGELVDHVFGARALVPTRIACYRRPLTNMGRPEPDPAEVPFGSNRTEDTMYKLRPIALTGRRWCSRADEAAGVANRR